MFIINSKSNVLFFCQSNIKIFCRRFDSSHVYQLLTENFYNNYTKVCSFRSNGKIINKDVKKRSVHTYLNNTVITCNIPTVQCRTVDVYIRKQLLYHTLNPLFLKATCTSKNQCSKKYHSSSEKPLNISGLDNSYIFQTISDSATVVFAQNSLIWLHSFTGLPWWGTIILATIGLRLLVTLPIALHQKYIEAKIENLTHEMEDIVKELQKETDIAVATLRWPVEYARDMYNQSVQNEWKKLIIRENCHPMKSIILGILQIPPWMIMSISLRNIGLMLPNQDASALKTYLEFTTGGFGWITNLAQVDNFFILPVSLCILNLLIIEIHGLARTKQPTRVHRYFNNFLRLLFISIIPLSAFIPSGLLLCWTTSSAFGIFQSLLLMSPRFRRLGGVPETKSELSNPYKYLYNNLKIKLDFKKKLQSFKQT